MPTIHNFFTTESDIANRTRPRNNSSWLLEHAMKYVDGQEVRVGDRVKLAQDDGGVVVCSIDTGEYSDAYPEAQWGFLQKGIMVHFPVYGLIHYAKPDLVLVERARLKPRSR